MIVGEEIAWVLIGASSGYTKKYYSFWDMYQNHSPRYDKNDIVSAKEFNALLCLLMWNAYEAAVEAVFPINKVWKGHENWLYSIALRKNANEIFADTIASLLHKNKQTILREKRVLPNTQLTKNTVDINKWLLDSITTIIGVRNSETLQQLVNAILANVVHGGYRYAKHTVETSNLKRPNVVELTSELTE